MEIRQSSEQRENIENYTKRLIELLKQKKVIDHDIKELKCEFKEEGVPVGIVTKVFNMVKKQQNQTDSELFEELCVKEWIESNTEINDGISELNAKV
jgi:uncharacterized protein (UPF0335 family)